MVDLKTMLSSKAIQVPEEAIFDSQVPTTETLRIQHHQSQFIHLNDSEFYTLYSLSGEKKEDGGVEQVSFHIFWAESIPGRNTSHKNVFERFC